MSTSLGATQVRPPAELWISILHVSDCPWLGRLRAEVEAALEETGTTALVEEIGGPFLSPTLLINGVAIDGYPLTAQAACRIGLPSREEITSAIVAARDRTTIIITDRADQT